MSTARSPSTGPDGSALFVNGALTNYSGTQFKVAVNREVRLLDAATAWRKLDVMPAEGVRLVGFETDNQIRNAGRNAWQKDSGLLSIWILGMYNPSPSATIVVPIKKGPDSELGVKVTSDYFGNIPVVRRNFTLVIMAIIVLSVMMHTYLRKRGD